MAVLICTSFLARFLGKPVFRARHHYGNRVAYYVSLVARKGYGDLRLVARDAARSENQGPIELM